MKDRCGTIIRVNEIQNYKEDDDVWYKEKLLIGTWKSMVVNHSKDIKDLIQKGDFVNGYKVDEVYKGTFETIIYANDYSIEITKIESILTKEMYELNLYKVVE